MSETITIDVLHIARQAAKDRFKGIGEPLIELPLDQVTFHTGSDGLPVLSMRADRFISLAEDYATPAPLNAEDQLP